MAIKKYLDLTGLSIFKSKSDAKQKAAITKATIGKQNKLRTGHGLLITDDDVISITLDNSMFVVTQSLPETPSSRDINRIFLIPNGDEFDEYIYDTYSETNWKKLGTRPIGTILTDYYTKVEVNALLAAKFKDPMTEEAFEALEASGGLEAGAYYPTYEE